MGGDPSKIGFGDQPFGATEFGSADWAEEVTWKIIPEFYRNLDANPGGLVDAPLRGFIDSIKPLFQEIKDKLDLFPSLWDANRCPFPQLPALAYNVGIDITSIQNLQLTQVTAAPFTIGEQITGSISGSIGFLNTVTGLIFGLVGIRGPGFRQGETITGSSSNKIAIVQSAVGNGSIQTLILDTFTIGETITGQRTGTRAVVGSVTSGSINVDTVTGVGFSNGEVVLGSQSEVSGIVNGITSDGKTENLLRSQVLNASQLWITKGTNKGYSIVAAFEGLLVLITPLWSETCDPDPNGELLTITGPDAGSYLTFFDLQLADQIAMDTFYNDPFAAWPKDVDSVKILPNFPEGRCRSFSLRLFFFTPDDTEIEDFDAISSRILTNLEKFRPIYVKFDRVTFDGPRVSTQQWLDPQIISENSTVATWNTVVSGALIGSSESWSLSNLPM